MTSRSTTKTKPRMNPNLSAADLAQAPSWWLLALESRAPFELGASILASPLLHYAARGEGHPVMVLPGLAAGDLTTLPLRQFLQDRGFKPYGWELGPNYGPREGVLESCIARLRELRREHGRKVSLVGWSLGGVYARELAKMLSEDVRDVITLGSPFTGNPRASNAWRLFEFASGKKVGDAKLHEQIKRTPPVPTTSIYSRTDGIVAWQCSLEKNTARSESIEVVASHVGLGMNPAAFYAIADRLAQPEGKWKAFHRDGWRRWAFPDPDRPA